MEKLKTPLMVNAVYLILLGLTTLSPGLTRSVFGYDVKDAGTLLVLSGTFLAFGVLVWGVSADPAKYGGLATYVVYGLAITTLFLLYGWWLAKLFTARNALIPVIINVVIAGWIWTSRPKS